MKRHAFCGWLIAAFVAGGLFSGRADRPPGHSAGVPPSANAAEEPGASGSSAPEWLTGTADEKFARIERHLRGLDQSMAEIGYRYGELLVAARTGNWEYARYQAEKIDLSLRLAIERRPKRAESARPFLNESLPPVLEAIEAGDASRLTVSLEQLHAGCVQCHKEEKVLHFKEAVDRIKAQAQRID